MVRGGGGASDLEPNPVHGLSQPGVVGQLFSGAHSCYYRASVPNVLGANFVNVFSSYVLRNREN